MRNAQQRQLPREIYPLFLVVLMDMIGFGFIIPLLPDYAARFGAAPAVIGLLTGTYAFGQLVSSPIVGRLSDRFGRKPLLIFSISGTVVALVLLGLSWALPVVFAARAFDGLTGGNFTVVQSYVADITEPEDRARGLGIIGAAFGLGFILGPLFGGVLVTFGFAVPALTAAGVALVNLVVISAVLPESLTDERRKRRSAAGTEPRSRLSPRFLLQTLRKPAVGPLLSMILVWGLAFTTFELTFSLFAMEALSIGPRLRSFILAYIGVIVALVQGVLIGPITRLLGERTVIIASAFLLSACFVLWGFSTSVAFLVIVLLPISVAAGLMNPVLRSVLSQSVPEQEVGGIFGLSTSADSLNRVIGPSIGGFLIGSIGVWAPGVFGGMLMVVTAAMAVHQFRRVRSPSPELRQEQPGT